MVLCLNRYGFFHRILVVSHPLQRNGVAGFQRLIRGGCQDIVGSNRYIGFRQEFVRTFLIPLICSAVMGGVVYGLYFVLDLLLPFADASVLARTVATGLKLFPVIGIGAFVYFVLLLLLRGVTRKELLEFPKGATLLRVARRLRLM